MFFDPKVNVEVELQMVVRLEKSFRSSPNNRKLLEINSIGERVGKYFSYYITTDSGKVSPVKQAVLQQISKELAMLQRATDILTIEKSLQNIFVLYTQYNKFPSMYVLRHPEKADPARDGPEEPAQRALTKNGVKQAKDFAEILIKELLITNIPVELVIEYSPYKRTRLFAEIIKRKVEWMEQKYGKHVFIKTAECSALSGDMVKPVTAPLASWITSQNAVEVSALMEEWFTHKVKVPEKYIIYIAVTHLFHLASFLVHRLGISYRKAQKVAYAAYIKSENNKYYYDGKWY